MDGVSVQRGNCAMTHTKRFRLARLASPRLTVAFFFLLAAGVLAVTKLGWPPTWATLVPFTLLVLNLSAAIIHHPRLRMDMPLLLFHFALLAFVGLLVVARLSYFEGRASLVVGETFAGEVQFSEKGPFFDPIQLSQMRFTSLALVEDMRTFGKYTATLNRVAWQAPDGNQKTSEIGDDLPLVIDGMRVYTTRNRGFAPIFHWQPIGGMSEFGSVHLRDQGRGGFTPDGGWFLPGGPEMWVMIEPFADSEPVPATRANLNADQLADRLLVRIGESRYPLRLGEEIDLPEGRLTYMALRPWIGYRISYDPTVPWLVAVLVTAVGALVWFYARQFLRYSTPPAGAQHIQERHA